MTDTYEDWQVHHFPQIPLGPRAMKNPFANPVEDTLECDQKEEPIQPMRRCRQLAVSACYVVLTSCVNNK